MRNQLLRSVLFCATSLVLGFAIAEAVVRMMVPDLTRASLIERLTNEQPTWARPDAEFHHVGEGIHHLNFPSPSDKKVDRVMIVGDSYAMGERVGEAKRFGSLLQQHLREGARVDVLAVTGYSPVIYQNIVRKAFSLASYRAVILSIDQTDPADELIYEEDIAKSEPNIRFDVDRMRDRDKELNIAYSALLNDLSGLFNIRSLALYNLFHPPSIGDYFHSTDRNYLYVKQSLERPQLIGEFILDSNSDRTKKMQALLTKYLDQIVMQCQALKVPVFMFANPWEFETSARPRITLGLPGPFPKENRLESVLLERYGSMLNVHVVRMTSYLRANPNPSRLYVDNPGHEFHWNAQGHAAAEAILRQQLFAILPDLQPKP